MKIRKFSPATLGAEATKGATLVGGMVLGKAAQKLIGQDTLLVNAGMAVTGLAVATFIDHPIANSLAQGLFLYGTLKSLSTVAKDVAPVGVSGLGFTAPDGVRAFINNYVPALGNVDEASFYLPAPAPYKSNVMLMGAASGMQNFAALV